MRRVLPLLSLLIWPSTALAQDAISVELVGKAQVGQGQPELIVQAHQLVLEITLDVKRSVDGKKVKLKTGPIGAGRTHHFPLELRRPGKARFEGELSIDLGKGNTASMPIGVDVELMKQLELRIAPDDVDLSAKVLEFTSSRPVKKVQVSVMSETGVLLGTTETELPEPAGVRGKGQASWSQKPGKVMRINVQGYDVNGFFGEVEIYPWRFTIPHEEVNFATGSYEITKDEAPKLETSYELLQEAVQKYGGLAKIRLFIAGHTDSVGTAASNDVLSNNRARAIGQWFRKRGIRIPILYAGFGESKLLVNTPDETDEIRNRRAEYIVAIEAPAIAGAKWTPL